MDYFKNFKVVKYDFTTNEDTQQLHTLADITSRVQLYYPDSAIDSLFNDYVIKDWDTPEKISYSLYGTTDFYWTIMYINNIFDMYNDWPLTPTEIQKHAEHMYPGTAAAPLDTFSVIAQYYPSGSFTITLPTNNIDTIVPIFPERVQVGTYVDPIVAGENCRVTGITNTNTSLILTIDKPTYTYPNDDYNEVVTLNNFSSSTAEYLSIAYYMNANNVIKDLDTALVTDKIFGITKLDDLVITNEKKRRIKVLKSDKVVEFSTMYFNRISL